MADPGRRRGRLLGRSGSRGFTLLELLLAITLVMLLMGLAFTVTRMTLQMARSGEEKIDRTNRIRIGQEFLRRQLNRAMPLVIQSNPRTGNPVLFEGNATRMRWVGPMPGYLGQGGPYIQELELVRAAAGQELVYRFEMLNGYDPERRRTDEDIDEVVLLDGIADGVFRYRSLAEKNQVTPWLARWGNPSTMPVMIQVDLSMRPDSRLRFPRMDVQVMVDAGGSYGRQLDGQVDPP